MKLPLALIVVAVLALPASASASSDIPCPFEHGSVQHAALDGGPYVALGLEPCGSGQVLQHGNKAAAPDPVKDVVNKVQGTFWNLLCDNWEFIVAIILLQLAVRLGNAFTRLWSSKDGKAFRDAYHLD